MGFRGGGYTLADPLRNHPISQNMGLAGLNDSEPWEKV
jgi:hypothetical protein